MGAVSEALMQACFDLGVDYAHYQRLSVSDLVAWGRAALSPPPHAHDAPTPPLAKHAPESHRDLEHTR